MPHENFYNPANGELITDISIGINESASSLVAYWIDEVVDDPFFGSAAFEQEWLEQFTPAADKIEDYLEHQKFLDQFLGEYQNEQNDYIAFNVTTRQFACGPINVRTRFVLNMSSAIE